MGLIRAAAGALGGTLADQWKEFFYCDAMDKDILVKRGRKRTSFRSANTKGNDNVISNGSGIAVADGQCMLIVEQGKVVEVCAEPGEFTYDSSTEPSIFTGNLGDSIKETFKIVGKRFTYGGDTAKDQRVYYINTKEIMGNKVGVGEVPFRDSEFGFTIMLKGYGTYSYRITDPIMFYVNVCGNVQDTFRRSQIDEQLKTEVQHNLQPALGKIALKGIAYDQLPLYTNEIADQLNQELTEDWVQNRGISVVSVALASITPDAESAKKIAQFQESRVYTNTRMMGARLGGAQANALENAAKNDAGAMTGFMGLGMAQQAGGANVASFFENSPEPAAAAANGWSCPACGSKNTGNFCQNCGAKKPENGGTWTCACGTASQGKFCPNCGAKKPE